MTDKQLAEACGELNEAMLRSLPAPEECNPQFSRRFERKMSRVIRRANHPVPYRVMQRVASFLLVLFLGFMTVLAVSPAVRAAFASWVRETYESFFVYSFTEEATLPAEIKEYYLSELPDGYVEVMTSLENNMGFNVYANDDSGIQINFVYNYGDGGAMFVEYENHTVKSVTVSGHPAELYIDHQNGAHGIVWVDEEAQVMFAIVAKVPEEELLALAESVKEK